MNNVRLELMTFVETEIFPRYNHFDKAHNIAHVIQVTRSAIQLAKTMGADVNMAYTAAAYHDLGMEGPRAIHHLTSGKIIAADKRLLKWFTPHQITLMKEAVEDHRASASHKPRNIYGLIVAEADRNLEPISVCRRIIQYGLQHYPEKNIEEQWQRFNEHIKNKYSRNGYIKLWIQPSQNENYLKQLRQLIDNTAQLKILFNQLYYEEITKQ